MNFPPTNWTLLAHATLHGDSRGTEALNILLREYRAPVVSFLRQRGRSPEDAEDLTQQLFLDMMRTKAWKLADRSKGRFRSFLLGILAHVVSHEQRFHGAKKRGEGAMALSLEELAANDIEVAEPSTGDVALFDREWAIQLVARALETVEKKFIAQGKQRDWAVLVRFLPGSGDTPTYDAAAAELAVSIAALKTGVNRVRGQFREAIRHAVAPTVGVAHEIDDELAYLHRVLSSPLL